MHKPEWLEPNWPAPVHIGAAFSLRSEGRSLGAYASFNLASHVGDDVATVASNRASLRAALALPAEPAWLQQVHGVKMVHADAVGPEAPAADGSWTASADVVCAVMVADCLPVLLTDVKGQCVAAVHAGWRGLCDGVLEQAVAAMRAQIGGAEVMAWLGPCIGPGAFEVGDEVRQQFLDHDLQAQAAFAQKSAGFWLGDLPQLAQQRLNAVGVRDIYNAQQCTYTDAARYYSYRRDGDTGRMAALIWRNS